MTWRIAYRKESWLQSTKEVSSDETNSKFVPSNNYSFKNTHTFGVYVRIMKLLTVLRKKLFYFKIEHFFILNGRERYDTRHISYT